MAQVTVELRNLMERTNFDLFDFDYTFDDQNMKDEIEQSIIDHYWDYEIGQETPDHFKQRFKSRFTRIIGYYNKLHNTTLLEYNPLVNYKITEALDELADLTRGEDREDQTNVTGEESFSNTGTIDRTDQTDTEGEIDRSDYPQQNISSGDYLSDAEKSTTATTQTADETSTGTGEAENESTSTSTGNTQTTENRTRNYEKAIEGLTGKSYQELIALERENLIRMKSAIINELKPCFIQVW